MENSKTSKSTCSSNEETSERGNTKNEKTRPSEINLSTFDKRGIQEAKLGWRRITQQKSVRLDNFHLKFPETNPFEQASKRTSEKE